MKSVEVKYSDGQGPVIVWIEAGSADEVRAIFQDVEVLDELSDWARPDLIEDVGAYSLNDIEAMPKALRDRVRR